MNVIETILLVTIVILIIGFVYLFFNTKKNFISIMSTMYDNCRMYGEQIVDIKNQESQMKNSFDVMVKDHRKFSAEINKINNALKTFNNGFTVPASTMDV